MVLHQNKGRESRNSRTLNILEDHIKRSLETPEQKTSRSSTANNKKNLINKKNVKLLKIEI